VIRGRALRLPIIERLDRLDLTNIALALAPQEAYARDASRAALAVKANIRLAGNEPDLHNAVERFLGRGRSEIASAARETIEGAIRSVVAVHTVEELQADRERAAQEIRSAAEDDLRRLGIELATLQLERVELEPAH
jgi:flotillin